MALFILEALPVCLSLQRPGAARGQGALQVLLHPCSAGVPDLHPGQLPNAGLDVKIWVCKIWGGCLCALFWTFIVLQVLGAHVIGVL